MPLQRLIFLTGILGTSIAAFGVETPRLTLDDQSASTPSIEIPEQMHGSPRNTENAAKLTLYWDNDGGWARPFGRTDRHYTAGVGASLSWQAPWVDSLLSNIPSINDEFDPAKTDYAMGAVGALEIFTPSDIGNPREIHNDRPYAGWTYAGIYAQRANRFASTPVYESLEVDVGILGPSSLAENAQDMIHHFFNYTKPRGWNNQINDEVDFDIKYNRRWRFDLLKQNGHIPGIQAMPDVGLTAGSLHDEVHAGALFRLGWNLPDDFGPGHLAQPEDFTAPVTCGCENWFEGFFSKQSFYFFGRPYGELVARDGTLQGDTWSSRDPVTANPEPALFGAEYGLSHRFLKHFEFTYMLTSISPEFHGQHNWDTFGSVQLSFFTAW